MIRTPFLIVIFVYNLALLAGTVYLITIWNWNPWWFILTILLLRTYKEKIDE